MNQIIKNSGSRIFIQDDQNISWQLFNLAQRNKEGSIYLSSPEFTEFEWLTFTSDDSGIHPFKLTLDAGGHLSLHRSGNAHLQMNEQENKTPYQLPISGQYLSNPENNSVSLRHIFTVFAKKPAHVPVSPALARKSDQVLKFNRPLTPFVVVAFALPRALNVRFQTGFDITNFELLGVVKFPLMDHSILFICYKTDNMNNWPQKTMIQYGDGMAVPVFRGMPNQIIEVEFRQPKYELSGMDLKMQLDFLTS